MTEQAPVEKNKKNYRTPALWMIIFIYFCFSVFGIKELIEAVLLGFSNKNFMISSFFFSIPFWTEPLLFSVLGMVAVGLFKLREWARIVSVVLAWAIISLRIVFWIDLMMREFFSLPIEDVFIEAVILTVVSGFFLFVYYYFNIIKIKNIFSREEKKYKLKEALLHRKSGFALPGMLLAVMIILIAVLLYYFMSQPCPVPENTQTLTENGIDTNNYKTIQESMKDKIRDVENQRLEKMEEIEKQGYEEEEHPQQSLFDRGESPEEDSSSYE